MSEQAVIEIRDVVKNFRNVQAVKGLSLRIFPGEFVALLGPNGAGKTTLIEMIEGLQQPDSGEIIILGKHWKNNSTFLHESIGLSLQETNFIDKLTVLETLHLFASFYKLGKERVKEIMLLVNLEAKQKSYVSTLSGGQKQRLALGIALLNKPRVLMLDEPTTGLDPTARREIWNILQELKKREGTSMILTTHYMEEAEYLCDRILIMDQGKIIAQGTLQELIAKNGEGEILEFSFQSPAAINFSDQVRGFIAVHWDEENVHGKLVVKDATEALIDFIRFTSEQKIKITNIQSRTMTLDDLFILMTGRKLYE